MRYFANRQVAISREDEAKFIEGLVASETDHVFSIFHVHDNVPGPNPPPEYVGQCALHQDGTAGRLFVVICYEHQGRGYARAAILRLLAYAWDVLNLTRVTLLVRSDHYEAHSLYRTCGFHRHSHLPRSYKLGDTLVDMDRMSIDNPRRAKAAC